MSESLKAEAIKAGYRNGVGSQIMTKVDRLESKITRLQQQLRETEAQRDEAGKRYVQIAGELHEARGTISRLRECLKRLEWYGNAGHLGYFCPACGGFQLKGHKEDCYLAAALKEGE